MRQGHRGTYGRARIILAAAVGSLSTLQPASAALRPWNNTGTDFNTTGSWTGGIPGTADSAQFNADMITNPNLSAPLTILGITFGATGAAGTLGDGYTLSSSSAATKLTLTSTSPTDTFAAIFHNTNGTNLISAPLIFGGASGTQTINMNAGALTISGALTNTNAAIKVQRNGSGVLNLTGDNTGFTGTLANNEGLINFGANNSLGSGTLLIGLNFGTSAIDNTSGAAMTSATNPIISLNSNTVTTTLNFVGSNNLHVGNGAVMLGTTATRNINVLANRLTFGGGITEVPLTAGAVFNKVGPGILELAGQQNSAANMRISEGMVILSHADALPTGNLDIRSTATNPGILGLAAGDFTRALGSGAGQVQFLNGGGFSPYGGFAAFGATRSVNLGGNATPDTITWNTGGFVTSFNPLILSAANADATLDFKNPINLTSAASNTGRTFQVANGSAAVDAVLSGTLSGTNTASTVTKTGTGTLAFNATNTYTGTTTVSAGTLLVNGANNGTGAFTVAAGATLGGTGSIAGTVNVNGILSPGASPGTLSVAALNVNNGSTYLFEGGDLTAVTNVLDLNPNWTLSLGSGLQDGGTVTLFTYGTLAASPALTPTFDITNLGFTPSGSLSLSQVGNTIVLNGVSIVPEPATLSFVALATMAIGLRRSRRRD